jgi:hypothetical protein
MLGKLTTHLVAGLALVGPLAVPTPARAQPGAVVVVPAHHARYFVEFRPRRNMPWKVAGPYVSSRHAHEAARALRFQGFHTRVVAR